MISQLERYLDAAYVYRFSHSPNIVQDREDARRYGINCISLAHLALKDLFNYRLPPGLMCSELYADREHFRQVERLEDMQRGDLVWFGAADPKIELAEFVPQYEDGQLVNWTDFPVKHVAIDTGERGDDYQLLHSTYVEGTNVVWPLAEFENYKRYKKLYGITRLKNAA